MHALVRNLFSGCALLLPLAAVLSPVLKAQTTPEDESNRRITLMLKVRQTKEAGA